MINRTTKYALNVVRCLAREPGRRVPTDSLARETGLPANYLSKILNRLHKSEIVEGERGWRGGFRLRPEALDRPIRSITEIFERRRARVPKEECIFGLGDCDNTHPCVLHAEWAAIRGARDAFLSTHTIRDLLTSRTDDVST